MTNSIPPDPQQQPDPQQPKERRDEFFAVVVALATMGTVLFWGVTQNGTEGNLADLNPMPEIMESLEGRSLLGIDDPEVETSEIPEVDDQTTGFVDGIAGLNPFSTNTENRIQDSEDDSVAGIEADSPPLFPNQPTTPPADDPSVPSEPLTIESIDTLNPTNGETNGQAPSTQSDSSSASSSDEETLDEATLPPPIDFSDVESGFWATPFIDNLSQRGIVKGFPDGTFRPTQTVTRAEFAVALNIAFIHSGAAQATTYDDIEADYWANEAIQKATQTGFMSGYPEQVFLPNNPVTKLEVLVAITSGLDLPIPENPEEVIQVYSDRQQIPEWAIAQVATATQAGIVVNHPNTDILAPNQPMTRAETAAILYQAMADQGEVPELSSEYVVNSN